jgi:signal transduction histidine kinase/CheY-like chemotaxis protein
MMPADSSPMDNQQYLAREKAAYITQAARAATAANIFAPTLCVVLFHEESDAFKLAIWVAYMVVAVTVRTWLAARLSTRVADIQNPQHNLTVITAGVGLIGLGWGLGWFLLAPDLTDGHRMIYLYVTTGAMFLGMFGYGVHWPTFYAFAIPAIVPAISSVLWPNHLFPWPFALGITTLFIAAIKIAKNFAATYEESISQRFRNDQLYRALTQERDASIAANVAKSKFIASASHDLRQPMHAINLYLDAFDPSDMGEKSRRLIDKIKGSVTTVNSMFDSLLGISRLDASTLHVNPQEFSLSSLVQSLADICQPKALDKGLELSFDAPDVQVHGDAFILRQILLNLISNAIQYTSSGSVRVRLDDTPQGLTMRVTDTGCGISPEDQAHIFEEFYRATHSRRLHEGLGLGLTIVQRFCDLMGASIQVTSTLGQGCEFLVQTRCPVSHAQAPFVHADAATQIHARKALTGLTIAVIEDDQIITEGYRYILSENGAHVVCPAEDARTWAIQLVGLERIDCILSDYRLTHTTGDVVIQALREHFNQDIPALIVTADTSPSHINHFRQLNVTVLHKPIAFSDVLATIASLTSSPTTP